MKTRTDRHNCETNKKLTLVGDMIVFRMAELNKLTFDHVFTYADVYTSWIAVLRYAILGIDKYFFKFIRTVILIEK